MIPIPISHKISLSKAQLTTLVAILFITGTATASNYEPDKTPENVQKKAVIIKHDAKLFKRKNGPYGKKVEFMQLYFLLQSKSTRQRFYSKKKSRYQRMPVSIQPYTNEPDGWLDTNSFVEWNTLQMIKLEPQSGRKLAKIFEKRHCARLFGKYGRVSRGCQVLGSEPNRFTSDTDFQLLIPVFQKIRRNYEGGFIRVYEQDSTVSAAPASLKRLPTYRRTQKHRLGYDIVFVVDSNTSMGEYFVQTKEALQAFIKQIKESVNGQIKEFSLRIGILFYRSRAKRLNACNRGYLTKWGQHLSEDINDVIKALASEVEESCSGEQQYEAVLDGLNRAISSTSWESNHFKSIILIGNKPPYPVYDRNNPMRLSVYLINKRALKKNIRLITFKLGNDDRAFKRLAEDTVKTNKGRYYTIPLEKDNIQKFKDNLSTALSDEWRMLTIAQSMLDYKRKTISGKPVQKGVDLRAEQDFLKKYNLTQYETLIIQSRLPDTLEENAVVPEFVKGWIPQEIKKKLAVDEFIFMDKFRLKALINALGSFAEAALIGSQDGGLAFIRSIRHVLAAQTRMPANRLFRSGETLNSTLEKANILPFRTDMLTFTAQEVNTWKPDDYRRINTILKEKVKVLGEFIGNPKNIHHFGKMEHFYVPRVFFP
ncbi:MAG TPA: VWA domain-containing protein [Thiotrichaceae bacterium]|nr:VWA domain-containing protein [Thiotrichaceae bacterium]